MPILSRDWFLAFDLGLYQYVGSQGGPVSGQLPVNASRGEGQESDSNVGPPSRSGGLDKSLGTEYFERRRRER